MAADMPVFPVVGFDTGTLHGYRAVVLRIIYLAPEAPGATAAYEGLLHSISAAEARVLAAALIEEADRISWPRAGE